MSSKYMEQEKGHLGKRSAMSPNMPEVSGNTSNTRQLRLKTRKALEETAAILNDSFENVDNNIQRAPKAQGKSRGVSNSLAKKEGAKRGLSKIMEAICQKVEKALQSQYSESQSNNSSNFASVNTSEANSGGDSSITAGSFCHIKVASKKERRLVFDLGKIAPGKTGPFVVAQSMECENSPSKACSEEFAAKKEALGASKKSAEFSILLGRLVSKLLQKVKTRPLVFYADLVKSINQLVNKALRKYAHIGTSGFFGTYEKILLEKQEQFRLAKLKDISSMYSQLTNFKIPVEYYPRVPLQPRVYREIKDYKSVFNEADDPGCRATYSAKALMKSDLKGSCDGSCFCRTQKSSNVAEFAEFLPAKTAWSCPCNDKRDNVECDENCSCGTDCSNRLIQNSKGQILGADVKIQLCWGIDLFTRNNITQLAFLDSCETTLKEEIVDEVLKELNNFGYEGWEISLTFLSKYKKYKNDIQRLAAQRRSAGKSNSVQKAELDQISSAIKNSKERKRIFKTLHRQSRICQVRGLLRVFSKGLGVVCCRPGGIPRNSLIVEYFGEVYPTWYWYVKQDAIKSFLAMIKKDNSKKFAEYKQNYNMDFYNIMLEKSKKEPRGREIVVVDPILNGNFASRLSHSCSPNCCTLPVVSKSKYSIALFSTKYIGEGEELTFDYCSFTENEKEFQSSVCLCGHVLCNGHYLSYTKKHVGLFDSSVKLLLLDNASFSFLNANAILLRSSVSVFDERKRRRLLEHSVGDNAFKASPLWLKNWAYYVLEAIVEERKSLYQELLGSVAELECANVLTYEMQNHKFEIENLFFQRINNLIITIDKAQHFLSKQEESKRCLPPIKLMEPLEVLAHLAENISAVVTHLSQPLFNRIRKPTLELLELIKEAKAKLSTTKACHIEDVPYICQCKRGKAELPTHADDGRCADSAQAFVDHTRRLLALWNKELSTNQNEVRLEAALIDFISEGRAPPSLALLLLIILKYLYLKLSHVIKERAGSASYLPLSDILYFGAMTVNNFTSENYKSYEVTVKIRECDLTNPKKAFQKNSESIEEQIQHLETPIEVVKKFSNKAHRKRVPLGAASLLVQADDREAGGLFVRGKVKREDAARSRCPTSRLLFFRPTKTTTATRTRAEANGCGGCKTSRATIGPRATTGPTKTRNGRVIRVYGSFLFDDVFNGGRLRERIITALDESLEKKIVVFAEKWNLKIFDE